MTSPDATARNRYLLIAATRIVASLGAILGVILLARAEDWPTKGLGVAIVIAALYMVATVPRALAHRWRTPPAQ
jgi:type IV secretory pathway TrbD component